MDLSKDHSLQLERAEGPNLNVSCATLGRGVVRTLANAPKGPSVENKQTRNP